MALELRDGVFRQLPFGHTADTAGSLEPLVSQPAGRSTAPRIGDQEGLVAVGSNLSQVPQFLDGFDAMQNSFAGAPQFNFLDQPKQLDAFAIVPFGRFFYFFL